MSLPISDRLLACAGFVGAGDRVADVGCDHGYLGIYLLQHGIARSVIAADVREGPLRSAVIHANKYAVADKMNFYLSDGVQNVPRDFDTLVCAGMGAETMISILKAAPWLQSQQYRLILQCQSKTHLLRRYLSETGFRITDESVLRDGKFLYTVMVVRWEPDCSRLTPGQWYFSPAMGEHPSGDVAEHYRWVKKELTKIVASRGEYADGWMKTAMEELAALENNPDYAFLKEENHDERI